MNNLTVENLVKAKKIHKSFKSVKALDGVDFEIGAGEFTALLGPNGAGKTTFVEIIEGIQKPDQGEIFLFGQKWSGHEKKLHSQIGIALQETRFEDKITVKETLQLFASFYNLNSKRINEILELVNLTEKHKSYVVHLSGGQRQRLALGIALLNNPKLLILDEPTTGLDPTARREIWQLLQQLKKENKTSMILTTHYMEEAEVLCDKIVIMDHGKVLAKGTLQELISQNGATEIIQFKLQQNNGLPNFSQIPNIIEQNWDQYSKQFTLKVIETSSILPELISFLNLNNYTFFDLKCRYITLDDLFVKMTGRKLAE